MNPLLAIVQINENLKRLEPCLWLLKAEEWKACSILFPSILKRGVRGELIKDYFPGSRNIKDNLRPI